MGQYVSINDDVNLYHESSGKGSPLIFIPGWSMSLRFFARQFAYFSESGDYKALAYDPRGQGMSSKTGSDNNYSQRGRDLKAFMDALQLSDVVLAGWSNGCYDAYSYVRHYSTDNLKAFISIDMSPIGYGRDKHAWTNCGSVRELAAMVCTYRSKTHGDNSGTVRMDA